MATSDSASKARQPAVPANSPLITAGILNKNKVRIYDPSTGELADVYAPIKPFYSPRVSDPSKVGTGPTGDDGTGPTGPTGSGFEIIQKDLVELTDIESVTFEEYEDPISKIVKIRAYIKVRNTSLKQSDVSAVDVRIFDDSAENTITKEDTVIVYTGPSGSVPGGTKFVRPTPSTPSVKFDRTGTSIAWGWNNVSGLGSYSSVYYEWIISKTNKKNAEELDSGVKNYDNTGNFQIGNSGVYKKYRVSSGQGDTTATASARWLRVRAVVVGTDGKNYYSEYSNPI